MSQETSPAHTTEDIQEQLEEVASQQRLFWSALTQLETMLADHLGKDFTELDANDDFSDRTVAQLIEEVQKIKDDGQTDLDSIEMRMSAIERDAMVNNNWEDQYE